MKVEFTKIILQDCFAFQYQEFDFESGIHSLQGINGVGKTTIKAALDQGLFNKNPKGCKIDEVSNVITKKPYDITIFFRKGTDEYKVVNSRKKGTVSIEVNGKSISQKGIPANLELIREILGDSYSSFTSMTYQSTESTLDLVEESSDIARKDFINKILKFDELDELLSDNKEKLKQLRLKLKSKMAQVDILKTKYLPYREAGELIELEELERKIELITQSKKFSEAKVKELEEKKESEKESISICKDYLDKEEKAKKLQAELSKINLPDKSLKETEDELEECNKKVAQFSLLIKQTQSKLDSLTEPELKCSKCGAEVNSEVALERYKKELKETKQALEKLGQEKMEVEGLIWLAQGDRIKWRCYYDVKRDLQAIKLPEPPKQWANEASYETTCKMLEHAKETYTKLSEEYITRLTELTEAKGKNDLVKMVHTFNREAEANNKRVDEELVKVEQDVALLEKRIELTEIWIRLLGSNGYRVHRMNKFLQVLNQIMTKYSNIISKGKIKCRFYLTSDGKIEFSVVDADKTVPFSNWSGGEKSRVKLACLFAVLEILEIMGSSSYNILFLDEVFATLDESGREGLFEVLSHLKASGKCIYTVSHTPIANAVVFDSVIEVVKEGGISSVK